MLHFNEHTLEMAIMELFENEGYIYLFTESSLFVFLRKKPNEQGACW